MSDSRSLSLDQLDQQRLLAVRLRIAGQTLKQITAQTSLSAPTIIVAYKLYLAGGWSAVPVKKRGRLAGEGRAISSVQEIALFGLLVASPPDHLRQPYLL